MKEQRRTSRESDVRASKCPWEQRQRCEKTVLSREGHEKNAARKRCHDTALRTRRMSFAKSTGKVFSFLKLPAPARPVLLVVPNDNIWNHATTKNKDGGSHSFSAFSWGCCNLNPSGQVWQRQIGQSSEAAQDQRLKRQQDGQQCGDLIAPRLHCFHIKDQ